MIVEQPSDDELRLLIKNFRSVRRLVLTTNKRASLKQEKPSDLLPGGFVVPKIEVLFFAHVAWEALPLTSGSSAPERDLIG